MGETAAVILAAGKSTRMKSDLPKVLHEMCGQAMLGYVLAACRDAGVSRLIVVVGFGKDQVIARFSSEGQITFVEQAEQKGTGHAVMCTREALSGFDGSVLVIAGDMPLVQASTLTALLEKREASGDAVVLATTVLEDPTGYGRILRDGEGRLAGIVEHRDCTEDQLQIREVNPSYYCFDGGRLFEAMDQISPDNAKGEYYITDAVQILRKAGHGVSAIQAVPAEDATGINSRLDLAKVGKTMQDRIQFAHLQEGITIVDPDNTWIEYGAMIGKDTIIQPFTFIGGGATIGSDCRIGPLVTIGRGETLADGSVRGLGPGDGGQGE